MRFLAGVALAALCTSSSVALAGEVDPPEKRAKVTDIALKDLSGRRVKLSDHAGKVVVVNFWATWCVPCLQELPFLQTYYERYKDQGLVVLAITVDGPDTLSKVRSTVKRRGFTMPVLLDQQGSVSAVLNPRGTNPFTLFLDRNGRKAHEHEGYSAGDEKGYEEVIKKLLAEREPAK